MSDPIVYFSPDNKSIGIINDLLHAVYNHYPVGYPHFIKNYPGYLKMGGIVANKIDFECNDINSASNKFAADLRNHLPEFPIDNRNYLQFPNYSFSLQISSEDLGSVVHQFKLNIVISLLCDYYTVVFEDTYSARGISGEGVIPGGFVSHHSIFSYSSSVGRISESSMLFITEAITKYFPGKNYVPHGLLMETPLITGVTPFMNMYDPARKGYNFWELLFSNDHIYGAVIME